MTAYGRAADRPLAVGAENAISPSTLILLAPQALESFRLASHLLRSSTLESLGE
jgi:hypothetical protein